MNYHRGEHCEPEGCNHNLMLIGKNKRKMMKKAFCLIFAFLLSINSFAAVVSDNDGSAFITKAEFDSLKNNFQSQLDAYNTSIDNKIDGAIASYLAGTKIEQTSTKNIINSKWKDVSELNGVLDNTYKVPSVTLDFFFNSRMRQDNNNAYDASMFWYLLTNFASVKYDENWSVTKNCYRNLVTTTKEYPDVGDIIWDGQATRYHEKFNIARLVYHYDPFRDDGVANPIDWPYLDRQFTSQFAITMQNLTTIVAPGYVSNWDSVKETAWPIAYKFWHGPKPGEGDPEGTVFEQIPADLMHDSFVTEVSLDTDEDGKQKRYEHIVSHSKDDMWRLTNPNWINLLNASPESSITSSDLKSVATISGECRVIGVAHHTNPNQGGRQTAPITQEITNNATIPSLGLFSGLRPASVIYQDNEKFDISTEKKKIKKDKPTIPQGFQLLAAEKDTVIEWEPRFNYIKAKDSPTTWVENAHEIDVYFSNGPFSDKCETENKIQVQVGSDTTKKDYATTSSRSCKVKFTMPEDGIVYVKWVPHFTGTSYINHYWLATLDIPNCNTYKSTIKED